MEIFSITICDTLGRVNYKQYSNSASWNGLDTSIAFDEFLYDAAGRRKIVSHVDQNGTDTELNTYTYADLSKMTIADEQNGTTEYGYDQRGLIASIKYPSDNYAIYAHDALGRVTEVSYPNTNTAIASYDYLGNRIIGKTFANANLKYEVASNKIDSLGRITEEKIKELPSGNTLKTNSYTYAANTNRLGSRNGLSYTYNNLGQLVGAGNSAYTFDTLGNPTNTVDDNLTYTKNKEDRITEVKDAQNTVLADYQYDAAGRRARKTVNSVDTSFVYGLNGAVLSEISGSTAREYVYGAAGEVIYMHSSAGNGIGRYLVTDFRDSVIAKAYYDGNQVQIDYIDYNAWGEPTVSQGGDLEGLSILWNGYYYDDETGNYYLRNRFYSPQERNFITADPRGINPSGNWNNRFAVHEQYNDGYGLMVYAKSDPVNGRDNWGMYEPIGTPWVVRDYKWTYSWSERTRLLGLWIGTGYAKISWEYGRTDVYNIGIAGASSLGGYDSATLVPAAFSVDSWTAPTDMTFAFTKNLDSKKYPCRVSIKCKGLCCGLDHPVTWIPEKPYVYGVVKSLKGSNFSLPGLFATCDIGSLQGLGSSLCKKSCHRRECSRK